MALTGQAKTDYQREYMRRRRGLTPRAPRVRPKPIRFRILQRDGFRCQYCGRTAKDDVKLEIDHIRPTCEGGSDEASNLITSCFECNRSKGGRVLDYDAELSIMSRTDEPSQQPRPSGISDNQWAYNQSKGSKSGDSRGIA